MAEDAQLKSAFTKRVICRTPTFDHFLKPVSLMIVISKIMERAARRETRDPDLPCNLFTRTPDERSDKNPCLFFLFPWQLCRIVIWNAKTVNLTAGMPKYNLVLFQRMSPLVARQRGVGNNKQTKKKLVSLQAFSVSTFHFSALRWKVAAASDSRRCQGRTIQVSLRRRRRESRLIQPWQMNTDGFKVGEQNKAVKS